MLRPCHQVVRQTAHALAQYCLAHRVHSRSRRHQFIPVGEHNARTTHVGSQIPANTPTDTPSPGRESATTTAVVPLVAGSAVAHVSLDALDQRDCGRRERRAAAHRQQQAPPDVEAFE